MCTVSDLNQSAPVNHGCAKTDRLMSSEASCGVDASSADETPVSFKEDRDNDAASASVSGGKVSSPDDRSNRSFTLMADDDATLLDDAASESILLPC